MKNVERQLQSDLIDISISEFVKTIREVDYPILIGMQGVLRADYQQVELAWKDLSNLIDEKNSFTKEEGKLFGDLSFLMVNIEERCRILTEEINRYSEEGRL